MVQRADRDTGVIRLAWPETGDAELRAIAGVLESGQLTMGPTVAEFEAAVARACETTDAVAVSSGTAALHLAVLVLGIGPGDEVIVPAYTFPATANVVAFAGARPVLVDVDPETMNLDIPRVAEAITPRTRAVLGVHLFGRPLAWDSLAAAVPDSVDLVEDAAGALGARRQGRACGGLGKLGCLSFHPRKVVTTGEGGAITTSDAELAERLRSLRHHGIEQQADFELRVPGLNYRLPDVLCALGLPQLARLEAILERRRELAAAYEERLAGVVQTPQADSGDQHGWQAYVVQVDRRDEILTGLRNQGIEAQIGTYALNLLGAYRDGGGFPGAERCFRRALALPFHTRLSDHDVDRVCAALTALVA